MTSQALPSDTVTVGPWAKPERWLAVAGAGLTPVGRLLFTTIFISSAPMHFSAQGISYAAQHGVPMASILVPLSGVLSLLGGLSVLFGYHARVGAALLALFLIPVTLMMHAFWTVADPMQARLQQVMFMKNGAMLGAALLLVRFGAGPISIDARRARRATGRQGG